MIKAANITLYNEDDDEISIPLSPTQLQGIGIIKANQMRGCKTHLLRPERSENQ